MYLKLTSTKKISANRRVVFDFVTNEQNMTTFKGAGPIPGIKSVHTLRKKTNINLGALYSVYKTDHTFHEEQVIEYQPDTHYGLRMREFAKPTSWLIREIEESWKFSGTDETTVQRFFRFYLTTPLLSPIAFVMKTYFKKAVEIDMENIDQAITKANQTTNSYN